MLIGVVDYRAGNGPSVLNAFQRLDMPAVLTNDAARLETCTHIILPGVGSAGATMESLKELDIINALENHALHDNKPFLGICVGLQVLFEKSQEDNTACLGWLKGDVVRFTNNDIRVPQMGWNSARFVKDDDICHGLKNEEYFYFVNSYHIRPADPSIVLSITEYGGEFCSMIVSGNIYAAQFHIEKSGEAGLQLLQNFARTGGNV